MDTSSGDRDRFEQLVRDHRPALLRTAMRLAGRVGEAEDLVQETLVRAYGSYDRLEPRSHERAWLFRILHNTYISHWRRRKRERALFQAGEWQLRAPWLLPEASFAPPPELTEKGLSPEVRAAVDALPPAYRRCVLLVDVQQKTYREAAEIVGRPMGTVMSRLHRGRRLLRDVLGDYAREEGYLAAA